MSHLSPPRGGAPVGVLSELDPIESTAVRHLRQWFASPESRLEMRDDVSCLLSPEMTDVALETFGLICMFCVQHSQRPLVHHSLKCTCLGADESCFSKMIGAAADGQVNDTMLFASLIVRPSMARELLPLVSEFGFLLRQMTATMPPPLAQRPAASTLH